MSEEVGLCGGDDIGALVFDIGSHSLRAGYAQEVLPRYEIPAVVGVYENANGNSSTAEDGLVGKKYYVNTDNLNVPRNGVEVFSYMKDGFIDDWDLFEKVLDYSYTNCLRMESESYPVLMTESPCNPRVYREMLTEIMFEKYHVPAFYLANNASLASFSYGKATSLVVDSGATHTSAIPVQDGFVVTEAIVKSPIAGDYISAQCERYLQDNNIEVVPIYMVGSKIPVNEKVQAIWTKKENIPEVTMSWHNYMVKQVIKDFQSSVLRVSETPYNDDSLVDMPEVLYELPNGYNQKFGAERFRIPEAMFDPRYAPVQEGVVDNTNLGVSDIVMKSVGKCDPDIRPALFSGIVVTGGNSFMQGFTQRLSMDLKKRIPSCMKAKQMFANGSEERRFGSWIGGSIFSSCASFQQLWFSSQEYYEGGKRQIARKCPL